MSPPLRATLAEARQTPPEPGRLSALLMAHGSMQLRYYAPRGEDRQTPHAQDELYVVAAGQAEFVCDGARVPANPGDVLFARAGAVHRFEAISGDFATWVVFYGPEGGERPGG